MHSMPRSGRDGICAMRWIDWGVLSLYFAVMLVVGACARAKVKTARDFFSAGGSMPWWLSGISHHMSGYSSAVFVAYAGIAYSSGITIYIWWACSISLGLLLGSGVFPPRWVRLREQLKIVSPLEYLEIRYDRRAHQLLAWSGVGLKVLDVGAKWTAAGILLEVFANVPLAWGVLLTGSVTLFYSIAGGLWADALTDLSQFIIQVLSGCAMLIAVLAKLGGIRALWTVWSRLPPGHSRPFTGQYTFAFACMFLISNTLSYNGGTWSLAQRFLATPTERDARKAALLSSALYAFWPLVLFFPMWAAPLFIPHAADPTQSYAQLACRLLPQGLLGLVLAGLFAHTMAMTSSDANALSAVVVRDILPVLRGRRGGLSENGQLLAGRICTFAFLALSMVIALMADRFGGVIGLLLLWFGALGGPITVPMLLGMLRICRRSGPEAAIASWIGGVSSFALLKILVAAHSALIPGRFTTTITVGTPLLVSLALFAAVSLLRPSTDLRADAFLDAIARGPSGPAGRSFSTSGVKGDLA
jgi:solute:Na+ symporter, SSS family